MCLAVPGIIKEIKEGKAVVDYGVEKRVAAVMDKSFKRGDYVIVQGGVIVMKVSKKEAVAALKNYGENFK
jgi:hydrogenase expression/formation protein HypC